jgi:cytidylate kinase
VALPRTIAIDGPASSGKTSVSAAVARDLSYLFVDTGAFYRAVTLAALREGLIQADEPALVDVARRADIDITADRDADEREYTILLNGQDVTWNIRAPSVDDNVSHVAAIGGVRNVLNGKYRALASRGPVIMVGRDIGTIVLPDADLKIYLDASAESRAERRYRQSVAAGHPGNYEEILASMRARDALDSGRDVAPLRRAPDAVYVNTDHLDVTAVIDQIKHIILNWQPKPTEAGKA